MMGMTADTTRSASPLVSEVRPWNGAPALFVDGEPSTGLAFWHSRIPDAKQDIGLFAGQGVHLFSGGFSAPACWQEDGSYDFTHIDRNMEAILAANARALVLPRVSLMPPAWWVQRHPDEMQRDAPGGSMRGWAAFSSRRWRQALAEVLPAFIRYCEERYGDRFLGYHVGDGDCTEWSYSWHVARGDFSRPQVEGFRAWLRIRYGTDAALQKAWADNSVTSATAEIPVPDPPVWPQPFPRPWSIHRPDTQRRHIDYLQYHSHVAAEAVVNACRVVKDTLRELKRQKICGVFYGYHFWELGVPYLHISGHHELEMVLKSAHVDFLCAPETYQERQAGRMYLSQMPTGSLRLHGKLFYNEDDTRTHLASDVQYRYGSYDAATVVTLLRRNLLGVLREGGTQWWMDLAGEGWYRDAALMREVGTLRSFAEFVLRGDRRSVAQVAVIVSEESAAYLRYDPAFADAAIGRQISELTSLGAPFDVYRAGDLDAVFCSDAASQYRLVVFLDTIYLSAAERTAIRARVACGGRTLLWQWACGLIDDRGVSPEALADITGIRIGLKEHAGPLLVESFLTGDRLTYGTDRDMGPHLFGQDPDAQVAGWNLHRGDAGLLLKSLSDSHAVWSAAPAVPAPVLRKIARDAGVHLYTEAGDQVFAAPGWLALHAAVDGERTVRLPARASVRNVFSGTVLGSQTTEFRVRVRRGDTELWMLEPR